MEGQSIQPSGEIFAERKGFIHGDLNLREEKVSY